MLLQNVCQIKLTLRKSSIGMKYLVLQLSMFLSYLFVELDDSTEEEKDVTLVTTAVATAIAE